MRLLITGNMGYIRPVLIEYPRSSVWRLRKHWALSSSKETSTGPHPLRWNDGAYSIAGVATANGPLTGSVGREILLKIRARSLFLDLARTQ
jgi:hypothetical protein